MDLKRLRKLKRSARMHKKLHRIIDCLQTYGNFTFRTSYYTHIFVNKITLKIDKIGK